ncbi:hypothetical protein [Streptomyces tsukubensis]|uniref:hypothetical protein n=1 Tax=Streptomyces tsukubensis TaxID=83656 RepID=UPI0015C2D028|nr:hypothetical protein [Streptomyces tsukubensis]
MTTANRRSLAVRPGRDGHHPVTVGDAFVPPSKEGDFDAQRVRTPTERGRLWASR